MVGSHDAFTEEKISEKSSDHEVLAEELLEQGSRQDVPRDSIGDGCKNPVEFPQWTPSILKAPWHRDLSIFEV